MKRFESVKRLSGHAQRLRFALADVVAELERLDHEIETELQAAKRDLGEEGATHMDPHPGHTGAVRIRRMGLV